MSVTIHASIDEVSQSSLSCPSVHHNPALGLSEHPPSDVDNAYRAIAGDPQYKHFINIPTRIIQCIDYFGIAGNRELIKERLQSYYLFIGVIDNALDSRQIGIGAGVLDCLEARSQTLEEACRQSDVSLVTAVLRCHIHNDLIVNKFRKLYREVLRERVATSIETYMSCRIGVGSLTAELSYWLIQPLLKDESNSLCEFMKQVGAVGCLIDSLIDLRSDHRFGLLAFTPVARDYLGLLLNTFRRGFGLSIRHPGLCLLFLQAIIDNLQDPRDCIRIDRRLTANQKNRAASVA